MTEPLANRIIQQFPHCDTRVLHAPGECEYCDRRPEWQELRNSWGIAFTGHAPDGNWIRTPCPADAARPPDSDSDHRRWGGNRPTGSLRDPDWPEETLASRMLYGVPDDRVRSRPHWLITSWWRRRNS